MHSDFSLNYRPQRPQRFVSKHDVLALGGLRRADSGLVFKYEARPKPNPILVSKGCAKSRVRTFRSLIRDKLSFEI